MKFLFYVIFMYFFFLNISLACKFSKWKFLFWCGHAISVYGVYLAVIYHKQRKKIYWSIWIPNSPPPPPTPFLKFFSGIYFFMELNLQKTGKRDHCRGWKWNDLEAKTSSQWWISGFLASFAPLWNVQFYTDCQAQQLLCPMNNDEWKAVSQCGIGFQSTATRSSVF